MKKKYLVLGGLALGALALTGKYKSFANNLSFRIKKGAKVKLPFPYDNLQLILKCEIHNPKGTSVDVRSLFGTLSYQGKQVATYSGSPMTIKQGFNNFELNVNFSIQNLENVSGLEFNITSFSSIYNQIVKTPFETKTSIISNLGRFDFDQKWKIQEFI